MQTEGLVVSAGGLAQRWRPSGEIEALEDALRDLGVFDRRDQTHRGAVAGASQRVDFEDALEHGR